MSKTCKFEAWVQFLLQMLWTWLQRLGYANRQALRSSNHREDAKAQHVGFLDEIRVLKEVSVWFVLSTLGKLTNLTQHAKTSPGLYRGSEGYSSRDYDLPIQCVLWKPGSSQGAVFLDMLREAQTLAAMSFQACWMCSVYFCFGSTTKEPSWPCNQLACNAEWAKPAIPHRLAVP